MKERPFDSDSFVLSELPKLELDPDKFVVVGSGVLDALGIRRANDIDFVTDELTYTELADKGWKKAENSPSLVSGDFEVYLTWDSKDGRPNFADLHENSQQIDGYNFVKLERLLDWKKRVARPKDLLDVEKIEAFLGIG